MPTLQPPPAIAAFFSSTNAEDRDAFAAVFTDGATLDDWGTVYRGREAIVGWNETDNMGVGSRIETLAYEVDGDEHVVSIQVTGRGYNGGGAMRFGLADDLIDAVVITG